MQQRFSEAYLQLRQRFMIERLLPVVQGQVREPQETYLKAKDHSSTLTEKHLRAVWYDLRFERRGLKLTDGRKISVIHPGEWNTGEGPDFTGARIKIEDVPVCGDAELHLRASDWVRHGHHENEKYNQVVLHVVLVNDLKQDHPQTQKGDPIVQLELQDALTQEFGVHLTSLTLEDYPYRSNVLLGQCGKALGFPEKQFLERSAFVEQLIKAAGDGRILLKGQKPQFINFASGHSALKPLEELDTELYKKIMEGLGYVQNKQPMMQLAQRVPYSFLKRAVQKLSGEQRIFRFQAILFGAGGLLPDTAQSLDQETQDFVQLLWSEWDLFRSAIQPMKKSDWTFHGVRPNNFPTRRLAGLSHFLNQNMDEGIFKTALAIVQGWKRENLKPVDLVWQTKKMLFQSGWGYFGLRASFGSKKFSKACALIGEDRSLAIWVNSFLPLLTAWSREQNERLLEEQLYRVWEQIPVLDKNKISKTMLLRFLGAAGDSFEVKKEKTQQGLIQIFQDFCDTKPNACIGCPFPRLVLVESSRVQSDSKN